MKIEREFERRFEGRRRRGICFTDAITPAIVDNLISPPDAPAPDPRIGQAAMQNSATSADMVQIAREELKYRKERDAKLDPIFQDAIGRGIRISEANEKRAAETWERYKTTGIPAEDDFIAAARDVGTESDQSRAAGRAVQDVDTQFDTADAMASREMQRAGVTPTDGANVVGRRLALLGRAGARAGAATRARENQRLLGLSAKEGVAKFVRGLPSQGLAADAAALNAGSSVNSTIGTQEGVHTAGVNSGVNIMGSAANVNAGAANLLLGQSRLGMQGHQIGLEHEAAMWGAIGNMVGSGMGMAAGRRAAKGGFVKNGQVHRPRLLAYRKGGEVAGPGGPTEDAIPATIDGEPGAALSDGEFVIKADTTQNVYGPDTLQDVNEGKAEVIPSEVLTEIGRNQVRGLVLALAKRPQRAPVTIDNGEA